MLSQSIKSTRIFYMDFCLSYLSHSNYTHYHYFSCFPSLHIWIWVELFNVTEAWKCYLLEKRIIFLKHFISPFHYKVVVKASQINQWYCQDFIKHCAKTLLCHFQWCSCWWFRLSFIFLLAEDVSLCYCFV